MANVVKFYETGGPEVLRFEHVGVGEPGPGEVRIRHVAVGLNFADTYFRRGTYTVALPSGIGNEGAGVVEALGAGVTDLVVGDRVTYTGFTNTLGAYSTERLISAGGGLVFKGSGFYITDYGKDGKKSQTPPVKAGDSPVAAGSSVSDSSGAKGESKAGADAKQLAAAQFREASAGRHILLGRRRQIAGLRSGVESVSSQKWLPAAECPGPLSGNPCLPY